MFQSPFFEKKITCQIITVVTDTLKFTIVWLLVLGFSRRCFGLVLGCVQDFWVVGLWVGCFFFPESVGNKQHNFHLLPSDFLLPHKHGSVCWVASKMFTYADLWDPPSLDKKWQTIWGERKKTSSPIFMKINSRQCVYCKNKSSLTNLISFYHKA